MYRIHNSIDQIRYLYQTTTRLQPHKVRTNSTSSNNRGNPPRRHPWTKIHFKSQYESTRSGLQPIHTISSIYF